VKEIIDKGKDQILKEELEINTVELDSTDRDYIGEALKKYKYYRPSYS